MIWANAAVALSGRPAMKFYLDYPKIAGKDGRERQSTSFATCLSKGGPRPMLLLEDGSAGPALKIEQQVPGTLKWLVHSIWDVLEDRDAYDVPSLQGLMAMLEPDIYDLLFARRGEYLRRRPVNRAMLHQLRNAGSIDALAALLYVGIEADLRYDRLTALMVYRFAREHLAGWTCLSWMRVYNKRSLRRLIMGNLEPGFRVSIDREVEQTYFAASALGQLVSPDVEVPEQKEVALIDMIVERLNSKGA